MTAADLTIDRINIEQVVSSTSENGGGYFDELRLASTWEEAIGVPEPATLLVLGAGVFGLTLRRRT